MAKWLLLLALLMFGAVGCAPPAEGDGDTDTDSNVTMMIQAETNA